MRRQSSFTGPTRSAFTLAELLVVIVILGLLATILTPAINVVLQNTYQADTFQRVQGLGEGAHLYKQEFGTYPGQEDHDLHATSTTDYIYTGSQVLAAILFDMREDDVANPYHVLDASDSRLDADNKKMTPKGVYAKYESGMLSGIPAETTLYDRDGEERFLTIMDCFPRPHPIAYYMSTSGLGTQQYHVQQNIVYTLPADMPLNEHQATFNSFITDKQFPPDYFDPCGSTAVRPAVEDGVFLLLSPGIDGEWFGDDDVRNWKADGR